MTICGKNIVTVILDKKIAIDNKDVLYLLLRGMGVIFGIALDFVATVLKNQFDFNSILLFICIGYAAALLAGSMTIPCSYFCRFCTAVG